MPHHKLLTGSLLASLALLAGCANESGARMGLTSATAPVIAVLSDDLFTGEAVGYMDRTGTIEIRSVLDPTRACVGSFRYTASRAGTAHVRCNDGMEAEMVFKGLSALSGYGFGSTSRGPSSFTFGLTPEQAAPYLTIPKGKRLERKQEGTRLTDI